MTDTKVIEAIDRIASILDRMGCQPIRSDSGLADPGKWDALDHARWMCIETKAFAEAGRSGKAFRWLGFIQGILYCHGVMSIEESKELNRPDEERL